MEFNDWLASEEANNKELNEFIDKIKPLINDVGFNAAEFERKVDNGFKKQISQVVESLKIEENA